MGDVQRNAALVGVGSWTSLTTLVGGALPSGQIIADIAAMDRNETVFTLARIAGDLANLPGGLFGDEARAWTHDLLKQRVGSGNPMEHAISTAVLSLPRESVIAHAHAIYALQLLAIIRGGTAGPAPADGQLAFLALAINDYLPEWPRRPQQSMTEVEDVLASIFLCSIFNRSDDPLRFIVRVASILERAPMRLSTVAWTDVEQEAFGSSCREYVESFLVPIFFSSKTWGHTTPPVVVPKAWETLGPSSAVDGWRKHPCRSPWRRRPSRPGASQAGSTGCPRRSFARRSWPSGTT